MGTEKVIRITQDGEVIMIHDDDSPLLKHAKKMEVKRASDVQFDNTKGKWRIFGRNFAETKLAFKNFKMFSSRRDAITAEVEVLNKLLKGV